MKLAKYERDMHINFIEEVFINLGTRSTLYEAFTLLRFICGCMTV